MHFEILVEDQSGKKMLDVLVPKIIGNEHSFMVRAYKGIGRIPGNLKGSSDPSKRILLDQLPRLLRGYGKTFASYPPDYPAVVILVCDLDDKCMKAFREELCGILQTCNPQPKTRFCIAIEEGEAWFLGDIMAVKKAYPRSKDSILRSYKNDSICGTWERLADAVYPGGSQKLSAQGWQHVGAEKSTWAKNITPHMDVENNNSLSFCYFRQKLRELVGTV
ncbi:hypothetical protein [Methanosarcina sp. WWM596]|uniref:hypothetical protein n=1 Tax=Methanosarcina sp. WWM596 TaxID=1434103 RepID=UPI00061558D3|nr:hypothetical protein [Methanosarcina sp. WWM596]AKB19629.1 hypothetical protein MSWHS_2766 [Methanosarcina sp. WWM596]